MTDYSYMHTVDGKFHFICEDVWLDEILEHVREYDITVGSIHIQGERTQ